MATRVPIHASGPYCVPNVPARGRAYFTNVTASGAFRGFGVPQAAIAHEALMDELADKLGIDRSRSAASMRSAAATTPPPARASSSRRPAAIASTR